MPSPARTPSHVADGRLQRGILDTSVVIDLEQIVPAALPRELAVTSITDDFRALDGLVTVVAI